jgi:hypothetical protein
MPNQCDCECHIPGNYEMRCWCDCDGRWTVKPNKDGMASIDMEMELVHPTCVRCHQEWSSLPDEYLRDDLTMWCCNNHDTVWCFQNRGDDKAEIQMEVNNLHGDDYDIRWNCLCMEEKCYGKNVIYLTYVDDNATDGFVRFCTDEEMPLNISREELYKLIKEQK